MDSKPRARQGLLSCDHSKRGQRFVTILEPDQRRVTLLAPWEHAILVLCDGTRTSDDIAGLLADGIEGEPVTSAGVQRCLKFFVREGLLDDGGKVLPPAGPKTMANLQQAYREWHKDPVKTGRLLSGLLSPPFVDRPPHIRPNLDPTVALPDGEEEESPFSPVSVGSTLVVDGPADEGRALRSVLGRDDVDAPTEHQVPVIPVVDEDLTNVADLLAAVDLDLAQQGRHRSPDAGEATAQDRQLPEAVRQVRLAQNPIGRAVGGVARIPGVDEPPASAEQPTARGHQTARRQPSESDGAADAQPTAEATLLDAAGPTAAVDIGRAEPWARGNTEAGEPTRRFRHRQLSEAALTPTLVGQAPPDGGPPILVAPVRSAGQRVMASIGPEPSPPETSEEGSLEDTLPPKSRRRTESSVD